MHGARQAVEKRDLRCYASSCIIAAYCWYASFLRTRASCLASHRFTPVCPKYRWSTGC